MSLYLEFLIFSVAIFVAHTMIQLSKASIEKRQGLTKRPLKLFISPLPEYINMIFTVLLLFAAVKVFNTQIFAPLVIILATKASYKDKSYGYCVFDAICVLSIISSMIVAMTFNSGEYIILKNPFTVLSFIVSLLSISLFKDNRIDRPLYDISRVLALDIYLIYIFMPMSNFVLVALMAVAVVYLQFFVDQVIPRFDLHQNIRYSFGILFSLAILAVVGNIICIIY